MKFILAYAVIVLVSFTMYSQENHKVEIKIEIDEYWWGGLSSVGYQTPYTKDSDLSISLFANNQGNQAQPLLLSNKGRYVWSEDPISYEFSKGVLIVTSLEKKIYMGTAGKSLKSAFDYVSKKFFPSNGKIPDELLFTHPQYNTWIELMYDQNEEDILKYAQSIIDNGFPPGVLMIDDNWQEVYGSWEFSSKRFKKPQAMVK